MTRYARLFVGAISLAGLSVAHAQIYKVTLSGANEIPAVVTNGTGSAVISLNAITHEMHVVAGFSGLVGTSTASHVHCCVVQPANAGVATTSPTFVGTPLGVTSGSWDRVYDMSQAGTWNAPFLTASGNTAAGAEAAFITGVAAGQSYLNVHSSFAPGGEVRGFLVPNRFAANSALSAGGRNLAGALDAIGAGTGAMNTALVALAGLSSAPQAAALERLSPAASRGLQTVVSESLDTAFDRVADRLGGLRAGGDAGSFAQAATGLWLMGNGVDSSQGSRDGYAGYKNSGWGAALGVDHGVAEGRYVGASLNYSHSSLTYRDQSDGDTAHVRSTHLALFASQDVGATGFVEAQVAYGMQRYENTRNTGATGVAAGDFDGKTWAARVGGGMRLGMSSATSFTPQLRVDWLSVQHDPYAETGGGPFALFVDKTRAERVRASLGGQLDFGGTASVSPYVRAFYHHAFSNAGLDASTGFTPTGTRFGTPGQELERENYTAGAGVNFHSGNSFAAAITYDGTFSGSYHSHVYEAKLRWTF